MARTVTKKDAAGQTWTWNNGAWTQNSIPLTTDPYEYESRLANITPEQTEKAKNENKLQNKLRSYIEPEPGWEYPTFGGALSLAPIKWQQVPGTDQTNYEFALPPVVRAPAEAALNLFEGPHRAAAYNQNPLVQATDVVRPEDALMLMGGGMGAGAKADSSLGMFIGKGAKGIDLQALEEARKMLTGGSENQLALYEKMAKFYANQAENASTRKIANAARNKQYDYEESLRQLRQKAISPQETWKKTMWTNEFPDRQWRSEISDAEAKLHSNIPVWGADGEVPGGTWRAGAPRLDFKPLFATTKRENLPLKRILNHPELYEKYPEIADYPVYAASDYKGAYNPTDKTLEIGIRDMRDNPKEALSTLLHEAQHAIQHIEGFAPGGNPGQFLPKTFAEEQRAAASTARALLKSDPVQQAIEPILKKYNIGSSPQNIMSQLAEHDGLASAYSPDYRALEPKALKAVGEELKTHPGLQDVIRAHKDVREYDLMANEALEKYKRLAGERESRQTQTRQLTTLEGRRAAYPPDSFESGPAIVNPPSKQPGATVAPNLSISKSTIPDPLRMPLEELEKHIERKKYEDQHGLELAFGGDMEQVQLFKRLDRAQNNINDPQRADMASKEFNEKFGNLTPEQNRLIYGIGEEGLNLESLREIHQSRQPLHDYSDKEVARIFTRGALDIKPDTFRSIMASNTGTGTEQIAAARMMTALEEMQKRGWNANKVNKIAIESMLWRGYSKEDAEKF